MAIYFHGDENIIRRSLLPFFRDWTFESIDDLPERRPFQECLDVDPLIDFPHDDRDSDFGRECN